MARLKDNFNIETTAGLKLHVEGNKPLYRIICNFHATGERKFFERLESEVFIQSIVFRNGNSYIHISMEDKDANVLEFITKLVEDTLQ